MVEKKFKLLCIIQYEQPQTKFQFKKVKSHTNISGNNIIDSKVRELPSETKYDQKELNKTSYQVTVTQMHEFANKN